MHKYGITKHSVFKIFSSLLLISFFLLTININAYAQSLTGSQVLPPALIPTNLQYNPLLLRGIKINPNNPFSFHFIVDHGTSQTPSAELEEITTKSIKYFLTALTIPKDRLWVNLSPFEHDRIIDEHFGWTEMGRDMLAIDTNYTK